MLVEKPGELVASVTDFVLYLNKNTQIIIINEWIPAPFVGRRNYAIPPK